MFRPEMLRPMGLPDGVNVIAWGLSLERRAPARRPDQCDTPRARPTRRAARRPTMILYGIDNIRDLFGHKVRAPRLRLCEKSGRAGLRTAARGPRPPGAQVSLSMVRRNPVCRLGFQSGADGVGPGEAAEEGQAA
jgi:hypothetical protein